jgi:hypothetical protein
LNQTGFGRVIPGGMIAWLNRSVIQHLLCRFDLFLQQLDAGLHINRFKCLFFFLFPQKEASAKEDLPEHKVSF